MIVLDTNYLVRFFTRDIESLAEEARKTIENSKEIYIPTIVFAETAYILQNHYQTSKDNLIARLLMFIKQPNVRLPGFVLAALEMYKAENISFYDCLVVAEAIYIEGDVKSFDDKLRKVFLHYRSK